MNELLSPETAVADGADSAVAEAAEPPALFDSLRALIDDGQTLAEAEIAFQKVRARYVLGRAKGIAALAVLGLFLAFFTLVALVVGLLLALTPLVGPWGALAIVGAALLAGTALCALVIARRVARIKAVLFHKGPDA
ncbi:phage holin family protein [Novosphingobium lentum]|uniref:phage holin family protein n=1 Tax=Novosphingobium lentum TaxID=145287 RepID=UPI00083294CE|nr:phage holin family protein [Novosphingobium lentum]